MTRFERELSGEFGAYWQNAARQEIEKMRVRIENGEITVNGHGAAFWTNSGKYLPDNCVEVLSHTDYQFSPKETARARKEQTASFIESYRANNKATDEEKAEMRAAFGTGATVVDVISGEKISL